MIDEKSFSIAGNNHVRNPNVPGGLSQIDNKTLQWFGATVSASLRDGGPILVSINLPNLYCTHIFQKSLFTTTETTI